VKGERKDKRKTQFFKVNAGRFADWQYRSYKAYTAYPANSRKAICNRLIANELQRSDLLASKRRPFTL
jgi:hypothetical protein